VGDYTFISLNKLREGDEEENEINPTISVAKG
jgi:hypothetical protein